jgi:hypothetical protein
MTFGRGLRQRIWLWLAGLSLVAALSASPASAYTVEGGNILVRPVMGASVNVLRLEVATRSTPIGGMLMGVDLDYSFDGPFNLTAAIRPVVGPGFIDAQLAAGLKYRVTQLGTPFVPYASAMILGAVGAPLRFGAPHVNAGARAAAGMDYFIMRNLALGVEASVEASLLAYPILFPELTAEVLAGLTWRIDVL